MNYCYHFYRYREQEGLGLGLMGLFGYISLEFLSGLLTTHAFLLGIIYFLGLLCGLSVLSILFTNYLVISRKYLLTEDGIVIEYPFKVTAKHSWDVFSEIGICKVNYTTRGPVEYLTVIRCVVGAEKNGPKRGYGWWADGVYSAIHFRKIITILYTEERLEEFKKVCPCEITDYRGIRRYYHDPK